MKANTRQYEVVYWELTRISRIVNAASVEKAIAKSEQLRSKGYWADCQEDTEGTNGVERVYLWEQGEHVGTQQLVYTSGTIAGMVDPSDEQEGEVQS